MSSAFGDDRRLFAERSGVSRETLALFDIYANMLQQWQAKFNLVGPSTIPELWSRHFLDSWQLVACAPEARHWVDLGSGAGFPGAVIAIAMRSRPHASVTLIESNGKKAAFLQELLRRTEAPGRVVRGRIEDHLQGLAVDVVTARAVAALPQLLSWTAPLLKTGTIALFPKGRDLDKELAEAAISWDMTFDVLPSVVDDASAIVRVTSAVPKGTERPTG